MRLTATIARYLLGLVFVIFGLNGFLHFIHQPPPSSAVAVQYFTALSASNYLVPVFLCQLLAGILLLVDRFVPLALTVLAGVIFNILLYHITMDPGGIGAGLVVSVLWILTFLGYRSSFHHLLSANAHPSHI